MSAARFLDTNILLYAYDLDAPAKRTVALQLVAQGWTSPGDTAISVQVLQEMHVNLGKRGVPQAEATRIIRDFAVWPVVNNTLDLLQAALDEQARWKISLWDALILQSARQLRCRTIWSEDLNAGQAFGATRVRNPFV